jgi:hypothetical protein
MRRLVTSTLFAAAAGAAAVAIAASSASAAVWTVSGSSDTGVVNGSAGVTTLVVHDAMAGDQTLTCQSSSAAAHVANGTSNGLPIGTITGLDFNTCSLAGIIPFTVTTSGFPWDINALSQAGGVTTGTVTGPITAQIQGTGTTCAATVSGTSVPATYDNNAFELDVTGGGNLTLSNVNVSGCLSRLHNGDTAEFTSGYALDNPVTITEG